jgi:hypothetical protein
VSSLWHVQEGIDLTQDEVTTLEEVGFFLFEKLNCHPKNIFGDDASLLINKLVDTILGQKLKTRKIFIVL